MKVAGDRNGQYKCGGEKFVAKEDKMRGQNMSDKKSSIGILRTIRSSTGLRLTALTVLVVALSATAKAQCGESLRAMATSAASVRSQPQVQESSVRNESARVESVTASENEGKRAIVGLWHIRFLVGDQEIQEAFQIWNAGGTEVHNPKVDPRQGNVCLGAWAEAGPRTFKLAHRVWLYDTNGDFQGTGHLTEMVTVGDMGATHKGSFTLQIYDPDGKLVQEVPGTVVGERISPN